MFTAFHFKLLNALAKREGSSKMAVSFLSKISYPIVVIFGATGTGKSKLAIELAKKYNGEIISVDSMQVYTGLDIITNKVTKEEQSQVPHHLLNFVNPLTGITCIDFRDRALKIIEDVNTRNKLPILVGGTLYYLESILFDVLIPEPISATSSDNFKYGYNTQEGRSQEEVEEARPSKIRRIWDGNMSSEDVYKKVLEVDPEMAQFLHPGDVRKGLRCLEVFETSGEKLSSLLEKQKSLPGSTCYGGPIRFLKTAMLWLQCDKSVLDKRLDKRVDKMLEAGLVQELLDFHAEYNKTRIENNELPDYTKGIFQAIGFKEFHDYLVLDEEKRKAEESKKLLQKCVDNLKLVTRRYAKKQVKWVECRFLKRGEGRIPPIYGLDATDVSLWDEKVLSVATDIVDSFLNGRKPSYQEIPVTYEEHDKRKIYKCDICNRYFKGEQQFNAHTKGNKHRKMKKLYETIHKSEGDQS